MALTQLVPMLSVHPDAFPNNSNNEVFFPSPSLYGQFLPVCELEMHSWLGLNCSKIKPAGDIWSKHGFVCPERGCCVLNYGWLGQSKYA
jgi:hypothetical protein